MIPMKRLKGVKPNRQARGCADCAYCQGAIRLWCMNDDAARYRHTRVPGVVRCPWWEPADEMTWLEGLAIKLMIPLAPLEITETPYTDDYPDVDVDSINECRKRLAT